MPRYYIAIDGGGTKTDVVLFDDEGHILSGTIRSSTNPDNLTREQIKENFSTIFKKVFAEKTPIRIAKCFAGMSGADHPKLNSLIKTVMKETLPVLTESVQIENDAVNALWSGTDGAPGVVVDSLPFLHLN